MRKLVTFVGISAGLLALATFQNCSKPASSTSSSVATNGANLSGSGVGYDGDRSFVSLSAQVCADGSDIKTEVLLSMAGQYTLVRQNCQSIQPMILTSTQFTLDPNNPNVMIYSGSTLSDNGENIQQYCMDMTGTVSIFVSSSNGSESGQYMDLSGITPAFPMTVTAGASQSVYTGTDAAGDQFQLTVSTASSVLAGSYQGTLVAQFSNPSHAPVNASLYCFP